VINSSSLVYINNNPNAGYNTRVKNLQIYNNIIVQTVASRTGGLTMISMYTSDATAGIIDMKNTIFQTSNGANVCRSGQWTGGQLVHTNNIYKLSNGGATNFTLDGTEIANLNPIWVSTTDENPLNWDYNLLSTSQAINAGVNLGLTRDFIGNSVGNIPDIGVLEFITTQPTNKIFTTIKFKQIP
jgi:hypothetical protein